jgi:hypothetical protein
MNHYLIKTQQVRARDTSAGSKATMAEDGTPALDALQDPAVSVVSTDAQHQLLQASLAAEIAQLQAHVGQLNAKLGQAHAKNLQLSKKLGHNPHASFARRLDFVEKEIDSDNANDVRNLMLIVQTRLTGRQLMAHIAADAKEPDDPQLRAKWHAEQDEVSVAFMKAFDEPLMALLRVYKPMNAWACFDVLKQRHDCLPVKTEDEVKAEQQGLLLSVQRDSGKGMRGYLNAHDVLLARLLSARGTWVCDLSANDFRDNLRCILRGVDCDHDSFTQAARDVLIYQKNSFGARLDQLREASGPQLKDFKAELQLGLNQAWDRLQLSDKAPAPALPQDMVQMGLSQRVTTVNDQPAAYRCERCGSKSHTTRACEFKGSCNFCGNPGHMVSICRAKLRHDRSQQQQQQPTQQFPGQSRRQAARGGRGRDRARQRGFRQQQQPSHWQQQQQQQFMVQHMPRLQQQPPPAMASTQYPQHHQSFVQVPAQPQFYMQANGQPHMGAGAPPVPQQQPQQQQQFQLQQGMRGWQPSAPVTYTPGFYEREYPDESENF